MYYCKLSGPAGEKFVDGAMGEILDESIVREMIAMFDEKNRALLET